MPNDLTISGVGKPVAAPDAAEPPQPSASASIEPAGGGPVLPNPTLRLDAALGIVVIEFRNAAGEVASSIPTQQQLQAYRLHFDTGPAKAAKPAPAQPTADHAGERAAATAEAPAPGGAKSGIVA